MAGTIKQKGLYVKLKVSPPPSLKLKDVVVWANVIRYLEAVNKTNGLTKIKQTDITPPNLLDDLLTRAITCLKTTGRRPGESRPAKPKGRDKQSLRRKFRGIPGQGKEAKRFITVSFTVNF